MSQASFFPLVSFECVHLDIANEMLVAWGHRMGPLRRPMGDDDAHMLYHEGRPVAVATTSSLIRQRVGGGLGHITRTDAVELSRLCAERTGLCRVALRLWREFVLPTRARVGVSYQDADMHTGNTYRFDGWRRAAYSRSHGTDPRSGRAGRNKWIWVYPPAAADPET